MHPALSVLSLTQPTPVLWLHLPADVQGRGTSEFIRDVGRHFTRVARMHVDASRSMSREFYAVALGRKPPPTLAVPKAARHGGMPAAAAARPS
jgi:hypothetical protein